MEYSSFAALHQPQTTIFKMWDGTTHTFENLFREHYTYNTYNKPDYYYDEEWDATGGSWVVDTYATVTRYHYETYTTTGLETVRDNGGVVEIFPVPAMNTLNINATWTDPQPFTVSIMDMSGKTFTTWTVAAKKQYQEAVPVNELPPGNYIISLQGGNGRVSKQFSVIR
jgi:hypothetical protein